MNKLQIRQIHFIQRGFTLFEILVALFIFAILGTIAAIAFHSIVKAHTVVSKRQVAIQQIEIALTLMQRDFSQIIDRPIIDADGHRSPAVQSKGFTGLDFTRTGVSNPWYIEKRSNMQRVAYRLQGHQWIRLTWQALDQPPNSSPIKTTLLTDVKKIQIRYLDAFGHFVKSWPLALGTNIDEKNRSSNLPTAIKVTIWLNQFGKIEMLYPIRSRGFMQNAS